MSVRSRSGSIDTLYSYTIGCTIFINLYGNLKFLKDYITYIPMIPSFLKLKIVLPGCWALEVSKNLINCTTLCSCMHHLTTKVLFSLIERLTFSILIK